MSRLLGGGAACDANRGVGREVDQAERGVRAELDAERDMLTTTLRHARLNNELSDEQDGELTSLLEDARRQSSGQRSGDCTPCAPASCGVIA